jgi:hypothetical protein
VPKPEVTVEMLRELASAPPPKGETVWHAPDERQPYNICMSRELVLDLLGTEDVVRIPVTSIEAHDDTRTLLLGSVYFAPYNDAIGRNIHALREHLYREAQEDIDRMLRDAEWVVRKWVAEYEGKSVEGEGDRCKPSGMDALREAAERSAT